MKTKTVFAATISLIAMASAANAEGVLNIFAWAESISPELIEKYEKQTGTKVNFDSFTSNEDALTKLQTGSSAYDLVTPSQHFVKIMIEAGLLENFKASELPAFKQVQEKWTRQWWDPNNDYSIPAAYGTTSFVVNRNVYTGPVDSWKVFFEPTDLKGNIADSNSPDEVISQASIYIGVPLCTEDMVEMKKVRDLLIAQKPDVKIYTTDDIGNRISGGEVGAHSWWDGDTLKARLNEKAPIEYAFPKEGVIGWMDSFVIPKGSANIENAKAFINFMSEPENATIQYNYYSHSSPFELDASKVKYNKENAPELFPTVPVVFQPACSPAAQELVLRVWQDVMK
ncbi:extracellular solute-binding protein [Rhizobium sp. KVB221]|uniref:Putrescine-binding periplasmic protein n=1 Tax=Rhizobium setariae TaxID=2801340 RepID=A0A936YPC6_9HYPH|nr:extracellular solute-binding protein [Rhizobium setariae]MBL0374324.1 extracellular solute-binding protein [Rhizobium setariae]